MDKEPLVNDQINAGAEFVNQLREQLPVDYALWVKESEERQWSLYIVSSQVDDRNFDVAYGTILQVAGAMTYPKRIDPFQVKIISMDDPVAKAVKDFYERYPAKLATHYGLRHLGNLAIEDAYIYPPCASSPIRLA